jgi:hypothetical protein
MMMTALGPSAFVESTFSILFKRSFNISQVGGALYLHVWRTHNQAMEAETWRAPLKYFSIRHEIYVLIIGVCKS